MLRSLGFLLVVTCAAPVAVAGTVLVSGNSMDGSNATFTGNLAELPGMSFTFVAPSAFAGTSLAGYSMVWLDGFSQYISLASLTPFLAAGGIVLVQNPGFGSEALNLYPDGGGLTAVFVSTDTIHITQPGDPLNAGLTDVGLSGWGFSAYGFFSTVSGSFTAISTDGNPADAITIWEHSGSGLLVYTEQGVSQYLSSQSFAPDADPLRFLANVNSVGAVVPEPRTAAFMMIGLLFLCGVWARSWRVGRQTSTLTA